MKLILRHGFEILRMHRIELGVYAFNPRLYMFMKSLVLNGRVLCGTRYVGTERSMI